MTDREAMKLALEALNQATGMCAERTSTRKDIDDAITALRQALEQPSDIDAAVLAEREACSEVCESMRPSKQEYDQRFYTACTLCANAIRARGE